MGIEIMANQAAMYQPAAPVVETAPSAATVATSQMAATGTVTPTAVKGAGSDGHVKSDSGENPSEEEIKSAIEQANKRAKFGHANAEFSYHEKTKRISVKIIDQDTNEVIREIPPEETLDMISKMWELAGIIVDEKR